MTSFAERLRDRIAHEGPIPVERYMDLCLRHYYASRDPLGQAGDFTTSPEISQMFGELIGLWMAEMWDAAGRPDPVRIVELGPGRGTLMADLLRAGRIVPAFLRAARVHLVETSPVLRERQRACLAGSGVPMAWHDGLDEVPPGPTLLVANEFLDALPVRQFVADGRGWCERMVGLQAGRLVFGLSADPTPGLPRALRAGDVLEWPAQAIALAGELADRLARDGGSALLIDYGYWGPAYGDTLQALKGHRPVDPLSDPGEADLTTHVDFHRIALAAQGRGARAHGIATQAAFLAALGIEARAEGLKRRATPGQAAGIDAALARLTEAGPTGMGDLFKVLALTGPGLSSVPGLSPVTPAMARP